MGYEMVVTVRHFVFLRYLWGRLFLFLFSFPVWGKTSPSEIEKEKKQETGYNLVMVMIG